MRETFPDPQVDCVLISAGCTTGWNDWIHGELWVCPEGLLRRRLGLLATIRHGMSPTVEVDKPMRRTFSTAELTAIRAANQRNYWIPWTDIAEAILGDRPGATQLLVTLVGGRQIRLLWVPLDPTDRIAEALATHLGSRFQRD